MLVVNKDIFKTVNLDNISLFSKGTDKSGNFLIYFYFNYPDTTDPQNYSSFSENREEFCFGSREKLEKAYLRILHDYDNSEKVCYL